MPDIIQLLSDKTANQIAAGEVIQRPASVIKELLENAIDAGSSQIDIAIKGAGRTLIQVSDNGCGMTETDARMSFERHATSKIQSADDLFNIRTKGFRGEALASIAAIAQIELRTKQRETELGSCLVIEGSKVISQEPVQTQEGTLFKVKNLFFNVPARRNFLKSDGVETKHIIDEIERVAIPHNDIQFTFHHNGNEVLHLPAGSLRQRIVSIFGKKYQERLVPVEEKTSIVNVSGYILKPEFCKRTRGEQFFFVNNRFIKSAYLNHAIKRAYEGLLKKEQFPSYFLFMEVDPDKIDINIHPTKTEIKFDDEKSMYAIINSAVRNSLGKFSIAPSLDFEKETAFEPLHLTKDKAIVHPTIKVDPDFNPFRDGPSRPSKTSTSSTRIQLSEAQIEANLDLLGQVNKVSIEDAFEVRQAPRQEVDSSQENQVKKGIHQLYNSYLLVPIKTELLLIDQERAHRQVLFERFLNNQKTQVPVTQKTLFPKTIELENTNYTLLIELLPELNTMGFAIENFGKNTITVNGSPVGIEEHEVEELLEHFVEQWKNNSNPLQENQQEELAWKLACGSAIRKGKPLANEEMERLVKDLFSCASSSYDFRGNSIVSKMEENELDQKFGR